MADLPTDRLEDTHPFQSVGLDCFGHFYINQGKATRNSPATCKIWVVIFVCLPSRAIHLELLEGLDTSSFINALSRFSSIRGQWIEVTAAVEDCGPWISTLSGLSL